MFVQGCDMLNVPLPNFTYYRPAMPFGNMKIYFRGSFQFSLVTIQKYLPSGNLKFNNLGIFQGLKLRNVMGKIFRISLKLNFTPNTLGRYGFKKNPKRDFLKKNVEILSEHVRGNTFPKLGRGVNFYFFGTPVSFKRFEVSKCP